MRNMAVVSFADARGRHNTAAAEQKAHTTQDQKGGVPGVAQGELQSDNRRPPRSKLIFFVVP